MLVEDDAPRRPYQNYRPDVSPTEALYKSYRPISLTHRHVRAEGETLGCSFEVTIPLLYYQASILLAVF